MGRDRKTIPQTIDAVIWALEFQRHFDALKRPEAIYDTEWMVSWFANAIMAGVHAVARQEKEKTMPKTHNANCMQPCCTGTEKQTEPLTPLGSEIVANKELRQYLDNNLQKLKRLPSSRERSLAITKIQEAIMWLGMDLKRLGEANPYPNSYNPANTVVDPTAQGLKL